MKTSKSQVQAEIGDIQYTADLEFYYEPGIWANDPTERSDTELIDWAAVEIVGYNTVNGNEWYASELEKAEVLKLINHEEEFEKSRKE